MTTFTTDQWVILGLVFLLGLLIGMWLTSGGRAKWKRRYNDEVTERKALETRLKEREEHFAAQEKEWRDSDARLQAALRDRPTPPPERHEPFAEDRLRDRHPAPRDMDRDGVPDDIERRPHDDRR